MSNDVVIKIEDISKQYRLGVVGTGTLSHDLNRWYHKVRGKEDPYMQVGDLNDREVSGGKYVWALSDISFQVKKGEVLGIIGKNGAGKSTLLKLLSQVTPPTIGNIKVRGRIASLLEVGTGFHPELTGKENIYLNGAILGMTKAEITEKFDEIVDFSGIVKYVDTPVKRYSSGMKVRLGFAVAAHLEPEILVVDEVLAVGDAEFQKKCIGKMNDVSSQGRTVLFVSHNMESIEKLCSRVLVMDKGKLVYDGDTRSAIKKYYDDAEIKMKNIAVRDRSDREGTNRIKITDVSFSKDQSKVKFFRVGDEINIHLTIEPKGHIEPTTIWPSIIVNSSDGKRIMALSTLLKNTGVLIDGKAEFVWKLKKCCLTPDNYVCDLFMTGGPTSGELFDSLKEAFILEIREGDFFKSGVTNGTLDMIYSDFEVLKVS